MRDEVSELRAILMETNKAADYSAPALRAQTADVNLDELEKLVRTAQKRLSVLSHAYDCMRDGTHPHPMQALLHSVECPALLEDSEPLSDHEFFALMKAWGIMCEGASYARAARNEPARQSNAFAQSNAFRSAFMRGE